MLFRIHATTLILAAASALCLASDDPKPACNAGNLGSLWPEAANHDPRLRKKMARCGELELCTHGIWRYRWESLTVRIDQLRGGKALPKPAGCEGPQDAVRDVNGGGSERPASPPR
jgi:hypothetical protein